NPNPLAAATVEFADAFVAYQTRDFRTAASLYNALLTTFPDDVPTRKLRDRCLAFIDAPPPEDWDGAIDLDSK
ncbi:MAG: hypothetical protein ACC661_10440, partial [Verrucomicrobiales bacterium]